jgi:hypothetical protein
VKGGYETKEVTTTKLVPEAGEAVVAAVLALLREAFASDGDGGGAGAGAGAGGEDGGGAAAAPVPPS